MLGRGSQGVSKRGRVRAGYTPSSCMIALMLATWSTGLLGVYPARGPRPRF